MQEVTIFSKIIIWHILQFFCNLKKKRKKNLMSRHNIIKNLNCSKNLIWTISKIYAHFRLKFDAAQLLPDSTARIGTGFT